MITREKIYQLIGECLAALNAERSEQDRIELSEDTHLLSPESSLSSLDVVSLSVDLEERIRDLTKRDLDITPDKLAANEHPLRTVGTLTDYLTARLAG